MTASSQTSIAVLTGASRGLGKSMALHLADRGVDSIITYRTGEKEAREVCAQIEAKGRKATALSLDVADVATFGAFTEKVRAELSRVWKRERFEYLVNNAGVGAHALFTETTEAQFDLLMSTHLKGPFFLTQKLLPLMAEGGRILNVSSGLTRFSFPGYGAYAAMKGAIEVLTHYQAKELGERGISALVLAPGAIATDFGGGRVRDDKDLNKLIAAQTALGRVGEADDIGAAVAMLLSPDARWFNGIRLEASGGMFL